jgi:hypothetical protein
VRASQRFTLWKIVMDISAEKKVDVLIAVLESRMIQIEHIRNRSVAFLLWMSAIFIFIASYLITEKLAIDVWQKVGITLMLLVTSVLVLLQVSILHKGFHNHLGILVKTETILGLYSQGMYAEEAMFPQRWKKPAQISEFFKFIYMAVGLITLLLLSLIWSSEWWFYGANP